MLRSEGVSLTEKPTTRNLCRVRRDASGSPRPPFDVARPVPPRPLSSSIPSPSTKDSRLTLHHNRLWANTKHSTTWGLCSAPGRVTFATISFLAERCMVRLITSVQRTRRPGARRVCSPCDCLICKQMSRRSNLRVRGLAGAQGPLRRWRRLFGREGNVGKNALDVDRK
jgi:hypothetical protein